MVEVLLLLGGNILGLNLYYKNKKLQKKQRLHALMSKGSPQLITADESDKKQVGTAKPVKEKTPEERQAMRYLNGNVGSIVLLTASRFYPALTLPGIALAIYGSLPIYQRTYISVVREKKLKNDLLNGLVVTGTVVTGHFLVTALFTFVSNLGTVVVQKSKGYSEEMLKGVFDQKVSTVWLFRDGSEIETPIEEVKINDVVMCIPGS